MIKTFAYLILISVAAWIPSVKLLAQEQSKESGKTTRILKVVSETPKAEIRYSMIGYRDTLIFYTFKEQKAVLKVNLDNKDGTFPITAVIYLFEEDLEEEGIKKWLNNQHSDALFADAAIPTAKHKIPEKKLKVISSRFTKDVEETFGNFSEYSVQFRVRGVTQIDGFNLRPFRDQASVFVKK